MRWKEKSKLSNSMAYGTRKINAAFTKGFPIIPILSRINKIPRITPISSWFFQIFSSHHRLGLPKGLFHVGLSVKSLKELITSSILAKWHDHLSPLDLITPSILGKRYILWSFSFWSLLHSPILIPLGTKYSPQNPIFKNFHPAFFP